AAAASQMGKHRPRWELRAQAVHERFIGEPMKTISPHSVHEVSLRQWEVCRRLRHRAMKRRIETGDVERIRKLLLRLPHQLQRLWNVQGSKVRGGFQFGHDRRCEWLVFKQIWTTVHDPMSYGDRCALHVFSQRAS